MATKKSTPEKETVKDQEAEVKLETVPEEKTTQDELMALLKQQQEQIARLQSQEAEAESLRRELAEIRAREKAIADRRSKSDKQIVEEAIEKCIRDGVDPWTVTVPIRVKVRRDTNEKSYWLCVNGRTCAVPADDQYHEMRLPFASDLVNSMHADHFVEEFADSIQMYDLITNPHPKD